MDKVEDDHAVLYAVRAAERGETGRARAGAERRERRNCNQGASLGGAGET